MATESNLPPDDIESLIAKAVRVQFEDQKVAENTEAESVIARAIEILDREARVERDVHQIQLDRLAAKLAAEIADVGARLDETFEGYSDALGRLRVEMTLSAFLCWVIVSFKPDVRKFPIFGIELGQAPTGTIFTLVLGFWAYCATCFVVRFWREDRQRRARNRRSIEENRHSLANQHETAMPSNSGPERIDDATAEGTLGNDATWRHRLPTVPVGALLSFDQIFLGFSVPLAASTLLILVSLGHGGLLLIEGASFFAQQIWSLFQR